MSAQPAAPGPLQRPESTAEPATYRKEIVHMNFDFSILISNPLINVGVVSWMVAQLLKTIIHLFTKGEFKRERLAGAGGMPSSHSAVTCSAVSYTHLLEHFARALAVAAGDDRRVHIDKAVFVEELVDRIGRRGTHAERRVEQIRSRTQVCNRAQVLDGVALFLQREMCIRDRRGTAARSLSH